MKKLLLSGLIPLVIANPVFADKYLIDEMESLKLTLDKSDPDRSELSLRLADLYFDVSIQESDSKDLIGNREKALKLYLDVLNGTDGLKTPAPLKEIVIRFQIARVLNKLGRIDKAKKYYLDVYQNKRSKNKIKREAAFSVAEYFEEKADFNSADEFYKKALILCITKESQNYGHYKRAWLHYKEVKLDSAIEELKLSLFERDGSVREKVINDLLLFFSARTTNGESELKYIEYLISKTGKKELIRSLVEAFYGAGNRIAGSNVLVKLNDKSPDPFYEMRLLEEFYGFRDIELVNKYLTRLEKRNIFDTPKDKEESKEFKAMLRRVIVQFDSETQTNSNYKDILKRSISQYLVFYPNDQLRIKMQQGWLKVTTKTDEKIKQLHLWINEDIGFKLPVSHIRELRQTRLSLAQKLQLSEIVISESQAISMILKDSKEAREFEYVAAREYYKIKEFNKALRSFKHLSEIKEDTAIDIWALQSQNLLLDIYNTKKQFSNIVSHADIWLRHKAFIENKKFTKDINEMKLVRKQAAFQVVVNMGESRKALDRFFAYCSRGIYVKKSCSNAKILSIKLKDQGMLVELLEKEKDEQSLVVEYELMGRFSDAARLQEKFNLSRKSEIPVFLKIAILYEIDEDFKNRDRILNKMIAKIKRDKKISKKYESIIYMTLEEADLLNERTLLLAWSLERKIRLANQLSITSNSKLSSKIISRQTSYAGSSWSVTVLDKLELLYTKQDKISFYGRYSKSKFKRKLKILKRLVSKSNKYLDGADGITRVYILDLLRRSYLNLSSNILKTPLPKDLTPDVLTQVHRNLQSMAAPYDKISNDYLVLQQSELSQLSELAKVEIQKNLTTKNIMRYSKFIKPETFDVLLSSSIDFSEVRSQKLALAKDPLDTVALKKCEDHFRINKNIRMASYFTGRLNNMKEVK